MAGRELEKLPEGTFHGLALTAASTNPWDLPPASSSCSTGDARFRDLRVGRKVDMRRAEARTCGGSCRRCDKDALLARACIRRVTAGETIFPMGSPGDSMMAVLSGNVRISVTSAEGREIALAILSEHDVFGEIAMLDGKERTADARAVTPCTLAVLERRDVFAFLARHPSAWSRLVEVLCSRLRDTDEHIAEIALLELPA